MMDGDKDEFVEGKTLKPSFLSNSLVRLELELYLTVDLVFLELCTLLVLGLCFNDQYE